MPKSLTPAQQQKLWDRMSKRFDKLLIEIDFVKKEVTVDGIKDEVRWAMGRGHDLISALQQLSRTS